MGTWSTERFGNDDALDWFGELRESTSPLSFIQETLNTGSTESVVAASAVLAVMESYGGIEVHADVGGNLSANESQVLHTAMLGGLASVCSRYMPSQVPWREVNSRWSWLIGGQRRSDPRHLRDPATKR